MTLTDVAERYCVHPNSVQAWIMRDAEGGLPNLATIPIGGTVIRGR